jgi:hypothetical protein
MYIAELCFAGNLDISIFLKFHMACNLASWKLFTTEIMIYHHDTNWHENILYHMMPTH